MSDVPERPPAPAAGDHTHVIIKAGLSAIPVLGGPAAELFAHIIVPPLTKRRDEWLQSIAEGLNALERRVGAFSVASLASNESFVTMLMEVSQIAIRNHSKEKREALRNAVLNTALESPDELLQSMLLNFLSAATPWHLQVLAFYRDPESYAARAGITLALGDRLGDHVSRVFPELHGKDAFCLQIERDLLHHGLIYHEGDWYTKRTTDTGDRVLRLVSSPVD